MFTDIPHLEDLSRRVHAELDQHHIKTVALYVAHVYGGKPVSALAEQTPLSQDEIQKRIDFVIERLQKALGDQL